MTTESQYDVIVVGAGNAALCAAMSAVEAGASVLVLEKAPEHLRGGNSYFSGGLFRFAYDGIEDILDIIPDISEEERETTDVGSYPQAKFYDDIMRVTEGLSDPKLVQVLVSQSFPTMKWMEQQGVRWVLAYGRQSFVHEGIRRFWGGLTVEAVGAGTGLIDQEFEIAERKGVSVMYQAMAHKLMTDEKGGIAGVTIRTPDGFQDIGAKSVVLACGGFESNPEMRTRYLGQGWELAKVRGTQFNTGDGIRIAQDIGAQPFGHWSGCHAVAWDMNAPPYGDRVIADMFQKHSYPFGLILNVEGHRFVDEGADLRNYTYAKYGKEILRQPQRVAFQLFDQKTKHLLREEYFIPQASTVQANTIGELADGLGVDRETMEKTIADYNAAVQPGEYNPTVLDGKHTVGVEPPKSNWALPLDEPPYMGFAVTCGITFTFGGLKITRQSEVLDSWDAPIPGLYATGELTGGIFYNNYPGGSGLMVGSVFGKIAGANAAKHAKA